MKIQTTNQNRSVHTARIDQDTFLRIIAERVADKAGVDLADQSVTHRAYITSSSTSTGYRYEISVEITDDHTRKPTAIDG